MKPPHLRRSKRLGGIWSAAELCRRRGGCAERRIPPSATIQHACLKHPIFMPVPLGNRIAALHAQAGRPRSGAGPGDDPARLLHHEAERHRRDDARSPGPNSARCIRSRRRPGRRLSRAVRRSEALAVEITGYDAVSLQPNSGAQGEYAGLLAIRAYHLSRGEGASHGLPDPVLGARHQPGLGADGRHGGGRGGMRQRRQCRCRRSARQGREAFGRQAGGLMITYPSTHGVFEETVREICDIVHAMAVRSISTAPT
jgi:hypothetical protein